MNMFFALIVLSRLNGLLNYERCSNDKTNETVYLCSESCKEVKIQQLCLSAICKPIV